MTPERAAFEKLEREVEALRFAFSTALAWIAASANSPLRVDEVEKLIQMALPKEQETP